MKKSGVVARGDWSRASLDLMRFTLALVVVLGHLTQSIFQTKWMDLTTHAHMAVGGFFVLSGYTIRAVTQRTRQFDVFSFCTDRASRLLSVSIFALVLTIFADLATSKIDPVFYAANFGSSMDMPILRILVNLFLVSQVWGQDVAPFSNSPFWSLSYEAGFYAIWAAFLYRTRAKGSVIFLLLIALCLGPNILFMLPLWLLGVLLFDVGRSAPEKRNLFSLAIMIAMAGLLGLVAARHTGTIDFMKGLVPITQSGINGLFEFIQVDTARIAVSVIAGAIISFLILVPGL